MTLDDALELAEEWAGEVADPITTHGPYIEAVRVVAAEVRRLRALTDASPNV